MADHDPAAAERAAFEAQMQQDYYRPCLERRGNAYCDLGVEMAWRMWQARAALAAPKALVPVREHFELLRGALDHIAKTARGSRSQTRRLRWIELRAETALRGEVYCDQDIDLPKNAGPNTPERLTQKLHQLHLEKRMLTEALENCVAFIEDAHILEAPWHWEPIEKARAALAPTSPAPQETSNG